MTFHVLNRKYNWTNIKNGRNSGVVDVEIRLNENLNEESNKPSG